jgi:BMFP domain-containing protein YqiC
MAIDHKFTDTLNGLFSRIFREGISALHSPKAAEAMRESTDQLAKDIEAKIKTTATELIQKLQAGVVRGFNLLETDQGKLEKKVETLRKRVLTLEKREAENTPMDSPVQDHE